MSLTGSKGKSRKLSIVKKYPTIFRSRTGFVLGGARTVVRNTDVDKIYIYSRFEKKTQTKKKEMARNNGERATSIA